MGELGGVIPGTFLFEFFVLTSMRGLNIFRKTLLIFILAESTVWLKNNITYSTLHLQERHNYAESTIYVELGTRDNCCDNLTSFKAKTTLYCHIVATIVATIWHCFNNNKLFTVTLSLNYEPKLHGYSQRQTFFVFKCGIQAFVCCRIGDVKKMSLAQHRKFRLKHMWHLTGLLTKYVN